jgi:hypothetical protein
MPYSSLTNRDIKKRFGVSQAFRQNLFADVPPRPINDWLKNFLAVNVSFALAQGTEKARSEFIIAPIFAELRQQAEEKISIFSGWELNVDVENGLNGRCDFLISRSPYQADMEAPIVVAVEAKQENFDAGTTQCIGEMIGARIFNEREHNPVRDIYGVVTTGDVWRFLVLRSDLAEIDPYPFNVNETERIMGILWAMTFDEIVAK